MEKAEKKDPVSEVVSAASNIIVFADNTEKKLREKGLSYKTQEYFDNGKENPEPEAINVEEGTDMSTYLAEKRDDAQAYIDMKDKLSQKKHTAKKLYSKFIGLFKRKK